MSVTPFLDTNSPSMIFAAHSSQYQLFVDQVEHEPKARFVVVDTAKDNTILADEVIDLSARAVAYPQVADILDWYNRAEDYIAEYEQEASA